MTGDESKAELRKRDKDQAKKIKDRKKELVKALESQPKMKVRVNNYDFVNQGVPIQFTFQGVQKYDIKDGAEVELPLVVIDHINSLKVPESRFETDPVTGQSRSVPYFRQRWVAQPVEAVSTLYSSPAKKEKEKAT